MPFPSHFPASQVLFPPLFSGFHPHNQLPLSAYSCPSSSPALPSSSQSFWSVIPPWRPNTHPVPNHHPTPLPAFKISELFLDLLEIRTEIKQLSRDKGSPSLSIAQKTLHDQNQKQWGKSNNIINLAGGDGLLSLHHAELSENLLQRYLALRTGYSCTPGAFYPSQMHISQPPLHQFAVGSVETGLQWNV